MKAVTTPLLSISACLFIVAGCNSGTDSTVSEPLKQYDPPQGATWQWQLKGSLNTEYDVQVYDVDLFVTPVETIKELKQQGRKVICYFSAGSYEPNRPDSHQFDEAVKGNQLQNWWREQWLDVRDDNVRDIMATRIRTAASKGCDGVEPDNVDGHIQDTGFSLSYSDLLDFNRFIARTAREQGLLVGLKNNISQVASLVDEYDFAVNESCYRYKECTKLAPFYEANKAVLHVEYLSVDEVGSGKLTTLCNHTQPLGISSVVLPVALDDSYRFSCSD